MPSRPDVPLVLVLLGSVAGIYGSLAYPSGNTPDPLTYSLLVIVVAIPLFSVYWGLMVRRGMAVRLYRNQALGMSLLSIGFLSLSLSIGAFPLSASSVTFRVDLYGFLLLFWVDSSMRASQDMDPLSRDSLHWRNLRYVLWGLNFASLGVFLAFLALTGNYGLFDNPQPGLTSITVLLLSNTPFLIPSIAGIVALPIGALRSKDRSFRRQLQWFALALLLVFGSAVLSVATNISAIQTALSFETILFTGYCFYRSTRALVPLSRISSDQILH